MGLQKEIIFSVDEESLLRAQGIAAIYLFGSQAQGVPRPDSDFDFAILLANPRGFATRELRNQVYERVYDLLEPKIGRLCNLDIVFLHEGSLQLQFHVIEWGKVIFEADAKRRADFHEMVMLAHADFEPLERMFREAILARI